MYPCGFFYFLVGHPESVWDGLWVMVSMPWKYCSQQPCTWWCLCCNRWLCWIVLIPFAIFLVLFFIFIFISLVLMLITCSATCVIFAILNALNRSPIPNCFGQGPVPEPTAPPPARSIIITVPQDGTRFENGDIKPITFTAVANEPDGTPVQNPDVRWAVIFGANSPEIPLGNGLTISAVVPRDAADRNANRATSRTISALVTGAAGVSAASTTIQVIIGPLG
jgi:hypothetical protein